MIQKSLSMASFTVYKLFSGFWKITKIGFRWDELLTLSYRRIVSSSIITSFLITSHRWPYGPRAIMRGVQLSVTGTFHHFSLLLVLIDSGDVRVVSSGKRLSFASLFFSQPLPAYIYLKVPYKSTAVLFINGPRTKLKNRLNGNQTGCLNQPRYFPFHHHVS